MTNTSCTCGKPTAGAHLCDRCVKTFKHALVNVAAYWLELGTVARKQTRYSDPGGSTRTIGKSQPLPVDLRFVSGPPVAARHGGHMAPGAQLRWDTWQTVTTWTRDVMTALPPVAAPTCHSSCLHTSCAQTRTRAWPHDSSIPALIAYLARQIRWILTQPWCPQMLDEITHLERRLTRMIDRPASRWYAGKCSVLDADDVECTRELYATVDKGFIDCPACGIRHDVAERRDILLREAQEIHVTATEAAGALIAWTDYDGTEKKLVDRIWRWMNADRLEVRDVTTLRGRDRHLYRLGDIQALLIESAQQRQAKRVGAAS